MSCTEFNRLACELIEKIQELELQTLIAKYELFKLRERYAEQLKEEEQQ